MVIFVLTTGKEFSLLIFFLIGIGTAIYFLTVVRQFIKELTEEKVQIRPRIKFDIESSV